MDNMKTTIDSFAASDAKNHFGKLIDAAQRRPVAIKSHGRLVAYVISPEDMEALEDFFLGLKANEAMRHGKFLGPKKSKEFLDKIRNARD